MRGNRGISILEVLVSAVILGVSVLGAMALYKYTLQQAQNVRVTLRFSQVEKEIAAFVAGQMRQYLNDVQPTCGDVGSPPGSAPIALMKARLNQDLPSGISLRVYDAALGFSGYHPVTALLPIYPPDPAAAKHAAAKKRCESNQTAAVFRTSPYFSGQTGIYFCLTIQPAPGVKAAVGDVLADQPLFGEFLYTLEQPSQGTAVSCSAAPPYPDNFRNSVSTLVYSYYWVQPGGKAGVYKSMSNSFSVSDN